MYCGCSVRPTLIERYSASSTGLSPDDLVVAFVALGHFERKGLPQLLDGLARLDVPKLKLLVVGGRDELIRDIG